MLPPGTLEAWVNDMGSIEWKHDGSQPPYVGGQPTTVKDTASPKRKREEDRRARAAIAAAKKAGGQ